MLSSFRNVVESAAVCGFGADPTCHRMVRTVRTKFRRFATSTRPKSGGRDRRYLVGVELDERRVVSFLELRFADDAVWTLQIGMIHRPAARQLAAHLRP
jgi:hypothetical protein